MKLRAIYKYYLNDLQAKSFYNGGWFFYDEKDAEWPLESDISINSIKQLQVILSLIDSNFVFMPFDL